MVTRKRKNQVATRRRSLRGPETADETPPTEAAAEAVVSTRKSVRKKDLKPTRASSRRRTKRDKEAADAATTEEETSKHASDSEDHEDDAAKDTGESSNESDNEDRSEDESSQAEDDANGNDDADASKTEDVSTRQGGSKKDDSTEVVEESENDDDKDMPKTKRRRQEAQKGTDSEEDNEKEDNVEKEKPMTRRGRRSKQKGGTDSSEADETGGPKSRGTRRRGRTGQPNNTERDSGSSNDSNDDAEDTKDQATLRGRRVRRRGPDQDDTVSNADGTDKDGQTYNKDDSSDDSNDATDATENAEKSKARCGRQNAEKEDETKSNTEEEVEGSSTHADNSEAAEQIEKPEIEREKEKMAKEGGERLIEADNADSESRSHEQGSAGIEEKTEELKVSRRLSGGDDDAQSIGNDEPETANRGKDSRKHDEDTVAENAVEALDKTESISEDGNVATAESVTERKERKSERRSSSLDADPDVKVSEVVEKNVDKGEKEDLRRDVDIAESPAEDEENEDSDLRRNRLEVDMVAGKEDSKTDDDQKDSYLSQTPNEPVSSSKAEVGEKTEVLGKGDTVSSESSPNTIESPPLQYPKEESDANISALEKTKDENSPPQEDVAMLNDSPERKALGNNIIPVDDSNGGIDTASVAEGEMEDIVETVDDQVKESPPQIASEQVIVKGGNDASKGREPTKSKHDATPLEEPDNIAPVVDAQESNGSKECTVSEQIDPISKTTGDVSEPEANLKYSDGGTGARESERDSPKTSELNRLPDVAHKIHVNTEAGTNLEDSDSPMAESTLAEPPNIVGLEHLENGGVESNPIKPEKELTEVKEPANTMSDKKRPLEVSGPPVAGPEGRDDGTDTLPEAKRQRIVDKDIVSNEEYLIDTRDVGTEERPIAAEVVASSVASEPSAIIQPPRVHLDRIKMMLFSEGGLVHRDRGYQQVFAQYWDALSLRLEGKLSAANTNKCRSVLVSFLKTPKLKKLHNKLIIGLMERCVEPTTQLADVSNSIPDGWRQRVKVLSRVPVEPGLGAASIKRQLHAEQQHSPLFSDYTAIVSEPSLQPATGHASSVNRALRIPGAIGIDPAVRGRAQQAGMKVSENAVWLLVVAAKEYTNVLLKKSVASVKAIEAGQVPPRHLKHQISRKTKKASGKDSESPTRASEPGLPPGKTRCITAPEVHALTASMPTAAVLSLGGAVSRLSFESSLFSSIDMSIVSGGKAYEEVRQYLISGLLASVTKLPGVVNTGGTNATSTEEMKVSRAPVGGLGRGAKNLAALKARATVSSKDSGGGAVPISGARTVSAGLVKPGISSAFDPAPAATESTKAPGPPAANTVLAPPKAAPINLKQDSSVEGPVVQKQQLVVIPRKGKGFGVKNLATMRTRIVPKDGETDESTVLEATDTEGASLTGAGQEGNGDASQMSETQSQQFEPPRTGATSAS